VTLQKQLAFLVKQLRSEIEGEIYADAYSEGHSAGYWQAIRDAQKYPELLAELDSYNRGDECDGAPR
jgi:hypothetical protein